MSDDMRALSGVRALLLGKSAALNGIGATVRGGYLRHLADTLTNPFAGEVHTALCGAGFPAHAVSEWIRTARLPDLPARRERLADLLAAAFMPPDRIRNRCSRDDMTRTAKALNHRIDTGRNVAECRVALDELLSLAEDMGVRERVEHAIAADGAAFGKRTVTVRETTR